MGRRIEVELTSTREDGMWTWRAAGAKKPKGEVAADLLYEGAKIGDVVKVEAEFHLDGIEVTEVFAPKAKKERSNVLEMKSRPLRDDELVTTQRVARSERRGDRGERGDRKGKRSGGRDKRNDSDNRRRPKAESAPQRPKPKRLRPRREHRDALLAGVAEEHRPIVEQLVRDGMPGVRAAIEKQNAESKEAGRPEIDPKPILAIAEKHLGKSRLAEWRDRADAALSDANELDLRDLRSVVVAGGDVARDEESRAIVDQLRSVLDQRLESDHAEWLSDIERAVAEERVVRGLRLSSRPVKAGAPLPAEIAGKLAEQASAALAADIAQDRWATVLDALAFSPVRSAVKPAGLPAEPNEELLGEVRRLSDRIPTIAALFGIDPSTVPQSAKRRRPRRDRGNKPGSKAATNSKAGGNSKAGAKKSGSKPAIDRPHPGSKPAEEPQAEEPQTEEPQAEEGLAPEATAEAPTTAEPTVNEETADVPETNADTPQAPEPTVAEETAEEVAEPAATSEDAVPTEAVVAEEPAVG